MKIIGAGLAGLLAGNLFQRATLMEAGPEAQITHKAVLRFRSAAVGDAIGIEFRQVTVHKGIWHGNKFVRPSIQLANLYSNKVIGRIADRSIWNVDPATRYIAPENLIEQMAERCAGRIHWDTAATPDTFTHQEDTISTMPMPALAALLGDAPVPEFTHAPITVQRFRVPKADVFQTIYFPDPQLSLYRASITGSLLIAEGTDASPQDPTSLLAEAFGLHDLELLDTAKQRFGKIAPLVDDQWRRQFILRATLRNRVYSLGRFATWRNILIDDVLRDVAVIKRIIAGGAYAAAKAC